VFTNIKDDFYGGDSNSDSILTSAIKGSWSGLIFEDQSLDPLCKLKNCIIRFADKGIQTISASPSIEKCNINNNNYGVYATAASNPIFSNCDFDDNLYFAIDNVDKSFVINAENCWWGSNLGPIQSNTQGDGTSIQEIVTDAVDYTSWKTSGAGNPLMGDVSLNGLVQAYDASLILKYVVNSGPDTLNALQQSVADVTGDGTISAYDASLILQYVVGLTETFPIEMNKKGNYNTNSAKIFALQKDASATVSIGSIAAKHGDQIKVPVSFESVSGVAALQAKLKIDPKLFSVVNVKASGIAADQQLTYATSPGEVRFALASSKVFDQPGVVAEITLNVSNDVSGTVHAAIQPVQFLVNEQDMSSAVKSADIEITGRPAHFELSQNYPNPFNPATTITYQLPNDGVDVHITIYNILGQVVKTLVNEQKNAGVYSVVWDGKNDEGIAVTSGVYIYQLKSGNFMQSKKLMMLK
jgi:parallel beta-helix repeat protein